MIWGLIFGRDVACGLWIVGDQQMAMCDYWALVIVLSLLFIRLSCLLGLSIDDLSLVPSHLVLYYYVE